MGRNALKDPGVTVQVPVHHLLDLLADGIGALKVHVRRGQTDELLPALLRAGLEHTGAVPLYGVCAAPVDPFVKIVDHTKRFLSEK